MLRLGTFISASRFVLRGFLAAFCASSCSFNSSFCSALNGGGSIILLFLPIALSYKQAQPICSTCKKDEADVCDALYDHENLPC
jgi:hypothetical protein